jgi:hypothetical protein
MQTDIVRPLPDFTCIAITITTNLCDSEQLKVGLYYPALCELLNEDVGFFVNPNLGINLCVSCLPLLVLLSLLLYIHTC